MFNKLLYRLKSIRRLQSRVLADTQNCNSERGVDVSNVGAAGTEQSPAVPKGLNPVRWHLHQSCWILVSLKLPRRIIEGFGRAGNREAKRGLARFARGIRAKHSARVGDFMSQLTPCAAGTTLLVWRLAAETKTVMTVEGSNTQYAAEADFPKNTASKVVK
jgi:hypothetical protein